MYGGRQLQGCDGKCEGQELIKGWPSQLLSPDDADTIDWHNFHMRVSSISNKTV